jgi:hypothetical protein
MRVTYNNTHNDIYRKLSYIDPYGNVCNIKNIGINECELSLKSDTKNMTNLIRCKNVAGSDSYNFNCYFDMSSGKLTLTNPITDIITDVHEYSKKFNDFREDLLMDFIMAFTVSFFAALIACIILEIRDKSMF